jgi:apolipoprotein N-acyltransferase
MNTQGPPAVRFYWLWLMVGAALLPFTQFQTTIPLAAWISPVCLLRFARNQPPIVAFPSLALATYLASLIALRGVFPSPGIYLFGLVGIANVLPYVLDKLLTRRWKGFAGTLVFPASYVVIDWCIGRSPLGTLGSPAYSQFGNVPLTQIVSITGIWGLVFLIMWLAPVANEVLDHGFRRQEVRYSLVAFLSVLFAALLFGGARVAFVASVAGSATPAVRVASLATDRALWREREIPTISELATGSDELRGSIRPQFAAVLEDLFVRTKQQAQAGAKIVAWSEAAAFVLKEDEPTLLARAQMLARDQDIYLQFAVVVVLSTDRFPFAENRAVLIAPSGQVLWDYLKTIHPLGDVSLFAPGSGIIPVAETAYGRLATAICFDADFPSFIQQAGESRADILLLPAKDWQPIHVTHARAATFRAIENGCSLVRPTGDGLSIAVDQLGQVLAIASDYQTDSLGMVADVPTRGTPTIFVYVGDSFAYLCFAGLIALSGLAIIGPTGNARQA